MTRFELAYQMGTYQALAEMMAEQIRQLQAADGEFERSYIMWRLGSLADQFDEAKARHEAEKAAA